MREAIDIRVLAIGLVALVIALRDGSTDNTARLPNPPAPVTVVTVARCAPTPAVLPVTYAGAPLWLDPTITGAITPASEVVKPRRCH